jgi:hypothetical protein
MTIALSSRLSYFDERFIPPICDTAIYCTLVVPDIPMVGLR